MRKTKQAQAKEKFISEKMSQGIGSRKASYLWDRSEEKHEFFLAHINKVTGNKNIITAAESNFIDSEDCGSPYI